jgi:hypothetical protein
VKVRYLIAITSSLLICLIADNLFAQPPDTLWTKTFGGDGEEFGSSVCQTLDGGYVITGNTNPTAPEGFPDVYLVKTDVDGNELWNRTFGGSYSEHGRCIQQTSDGGYIIVGETESYGNGCLDNPDIYLIKTDIEGYEEWYHTYGGSFEEKGFWIEQTSDSGYIIVGFTYSYSGNNRCDVYLIKTNANGIEEWHRTYGDSYWNFAYCVQVTSDGGYIISGSSYSLDGPYYGGYLLKTDSLGNEEWSRFYDDNDAKVVYCVRQILEGGYILTGMLGNSEQFDIFLKKVTVNGYDEWTRYFGIARWDQAFFVQQTLDGGYIMVGLNDHRIVGYMDAYLIKTDTDGNEEWELTLGGNYSDAAKSVQQTPDGGYIVCGYKQINSQPESFDAWLIRLDSEGTFAEDFETRRPLKFLLYQPYPNPFNIQSTIQYDLPVHSQVTIDIYNILGRKVETLVSERQQAGPHSITWDAKDFSSAIYFYRITANDFSQSRKMILLK